MLTIGNEKLAALNHRHFMTGTSQAKIACWSDGHILPENGASPLQGCFRRAVQEAEG